MKFRKDQTGNPGGRFKVLGEVQELARLHGPAVIVELARLALKAKNETARIAAIRELLDRGYGQARQSVDMAPLDINPIKLLLDEISIAERKSPRFERTSQGI